MSNSNIFGPNAWLIDEQFQQYSEDPNSVDKEWREYFEANGAPKSPESSPAKDAATSPAAVKKTEGSTIAKKQQVRKTEVSEAAKESKVTTEKSQKKAAEKPARKDQPASPLDRIGDAPKAGASQLKGMFKAIAKNMDESLTIPTATTVRDMPVKLMWENRALINEHLKRTRGGKISFTHILGYAMVKASQIHPGMNVRYEEKDGKPHVVQPEHINLGLAIDLPQKDGSRALVVAAIKECENKSFTEFIDAYEDIVNRSRKNKLTMDDFTGVTINLTNPGGIGTRHSIARLTKGSGAIIGVGSMDYPAEFAGASADRLAELGVGRLVTMSSTYDHRVIQGAESGEYLRTLSQLINDDKFWDELFDSMQVPYQPFRWAQDVPNTGVNKDARVLQLIEAYRSRGHLLANVNPLGWKQPGLPWPNHRDLDMQTYGLTIWDLDRSFKVGGFGHKESMTLREVLSRLRAAYTQKVGSEFMHIMDRDEREWLRERLEAGRPKPTNAEQKYILQKVNSAEAFENFLGTKYVGQKRFSLEGAESMIPLMDAIIDTAAGQGLKEAVIGMPHRGRLNVLFNIVGKPLADIFGEFDGNYKGGQQGGSGDVKYHLGAEGEYLQMFGDGEINVTLAANPSHLEAVNPVLEGLARAKEDLIAEPGEHPVIPITLHGDASFAGLGVVQETINLSQLDAYTVGGTVHIVVNNQVGFTTTPDSGRSTFYATDLAKGFDCPVFHVNGNDPEAVVWVGQLATEYRHKFGKDVFIDLICYRLRGHNEADDPSMTQPLLYDVIKDHKGVRESYTDELIGRGDLSDAEAEAAARDFHDQMESVFADHKEAEEQAPREQFGITDSQELPHGLDTSITAEELAALGQAYLDTPETFQYHKRVHKIAETRAKNAIEGGIDWGFGELVAFGSLANAGRHVRLVGEDSRRGTFTQRHAVAFDPTDAEEFNPLNELALKRGNGGKFEVYNSALTEFAGLGFEYGYTLGNEDAVVAWEAQFGDFANGAQTIIDQYISSGEAKWGELSSLILLLPHGYEGQGPDHSSARIERFLQLCAEGSMTVAQPTTPANHFHLLRRQALGSLKRPLVVITPKSMLRNKAATSPVEEFTEVPKFRSVINDPRFYDMFGNKLAEGDKVKTIMLVSGKLYYDLEKKRADDGRDDIAIVRVEMLHPIPYNRLGEAFAAYPNAEQIRFVQDEPANQGPWPFYNEHLPELIPDMPKMVRVSRRAQSSTATGNTKVHAREHEALLKEAFNV
ncbi:multifunctional oxoglutarate decarboxylase/oxoglutarate dehydrogenase thiamine pyrophosphate-binding subunit/dihydrolipoyllysine-residue succinyltransferase subunit [Corynebacterium phocae]|uniref:multifunctional oxoglutarate decarboxylase/oxoglutarate dehydrogenase thiamine pyrophosphate-binding subunit/dihydrolipoyllysine-residue succinyltransferase subunit n=1 Tax=Corynebacterium phocae TaxID=161895 RepID=UPI000AAE9AC9